MFLFFRSHLSLCFQEHGWAPGLSHPQHAPKYSPGVNVFFIVLSCFQVWSGQGYACGVLQTRISEVFVSVVRMRVCFILVRVGVSRFFLTIALCAQYGLHVEQSMLSAAQVQQLLSVPMLAGYSESDGSDCGEFLSLWVWLTLHMAVWK